MGQNYPIEAYKGKMLQCTGIIKLKVKVMMTTFINAKLDKNELTYANDF